MKRLENLWKWMNVKQDERELVVLLIIYSFFMGGAIAIFYTVVASSFLVSFDSSALPDVYIVGGVFLYVLGLLVGWLQKTVAYDKLAEGMLGFLVLSILAMLAYHRFTGNAWVFFVLFIWNRVFVLVNGVTFWAVVAKLFNLQQSKRLTGLINSGDVLSSVIAYLAIPVVVHIIGTEYMLLASLVFLMVCGLVIRIIHVRYPIAETDILSAGNPSPHIANQEVVSQRYHSSYYQNIFLLGLIPVFALFYVEYLFFTESRYVFPDKALLASFLGLFFGVCAIFELLIKTFLYNRIIRKYGLAAGILILPVSILFGFAVAVVYGFAYDTSAIFFACIALCRFFMSTVRKAVADPAYQVLYQPFPASQRLRIQGLIEGRAKSVGGLLAGVALAALNYWFSLDQLWLSAVFLLIAIGWTVLAFSGKNAYRKAIGDMVFVGKKKIERRRITALTLMATSATYEELAKMALSDQYSERAEAAVGLGASNRFLAYKYLIPLLQDPVASVREAAIRSAGELKRAELWPFLFEQLGYDRYSVAASKALGKSGPPIIKQIEKLFMGGTESKRRQLRLLDIVEDVGGADAIRFLRRHISNPARYIRERVVVALKNLNYLCTFSEQAYLTQDLEDNLRTYAWLVAAQADFSLQYDDDTELIVNIEREKDWLLKKVFNILQIVFSPKFSAVNLLENDEEEDVRGYLIEITSLFLPEEVKSKVLPILESETLEQVLERNQEVFPQERLSIEERLKDIINKDFTRISRWTKSVAIKELKHYDAESVTGVLVASAVSSSKVISETAFYVLRIVNPTRFDGLYRVVDQQNDAFHKKIMDPLDWLASEDDLLLSKLRRLRKVPEMKDLSNEELQRFLHNSRYFKIDQDDVIDLRKYCEGDNVSLLVTFGRLAFSRHITVEDSMIWNITANQHHGVVVIPHAEKDTEFYIFESYILDDLEISINEPEKHKITE